MMRSEGTRTAALSWRTLHQLIPPAINKTLNVRVRGWAPFGVVVEVTGTTPNNPSPTPSPARPRVERIWLWRADNYGIKMILKQTCQFRLVLFMIKVWFFFVDATNVFMKRVLNGWIVFNNLKKNGVNTFKVKSNSVDITAKISQCSLLIFSNYIIAFSVSKMGSRCK